MKVWLLVYRDAYGGTGTLVIRTEARKIDLDTTWKNMGRVPGVDYEIHEIESNIIGKKIEPKEGEKMVKCAICGKEMERLTAHIQKSHGLTKRQYLHQFPGSEMISAKSANKLRSYLASNSDKYTGVLEKSSRRRGERKCH